MGWQLESAKMLGYLAFPVVAFVYFNHPVFYEQSLRQTMENMSKDINLDNLEQFEKLSNKGGIDKLSSTIEELDDSKSKNIKKVAQVTTATTTGKGGM